MIKKSDKINTDTRKAQQELQNTEIVETLDHIKNKLVLEFTFTHAYKKKGYKSGSQYQNAQEGSGNEGGQNHTVVQESRRYSI
jgi:hypothetical protein